MACCYLVCFSNIYNQFCHNMKRHSVTNIHVLRPLKLHRETFIFCLTLFMHKSELIPFLTKHSFKTLHQNLMLRTYRLTLVTKVPYFAGKKLQL